MPSIYFTLIGLFVMLLYGDCGGDNCGDCPDDVTCGSKDPCEWAYDKGCINFEEQCIYDDGCSSCISQNACVNSEQNPVRSDCTWFPGDSNYCSSCESLTSCNCKLEFDCLGNTGYCMWDTSGSSCFNRSAQCASEEACRSCYTENACTSAEANPIRADCFWISSEPNPGFNGNCTSCKDYPSCDCKYKLDCYFLADCYYDDSSQRCYNISLECGNNNDCNSCMTEETCRMRGSDCEWQPTVSYCRTVIKSDLNVPLIVGLAVGGGVVVFAVIVVIIVGVCWRHRKRQNRNPEEMRRLTS